MNAMGRVSRWLGFCVVTGCLLSGCGILPTEEEFDTAPMVKEYEGSKTGKYTVVRGDMVQTESLVATYQGTIKKDVSGSDSGSRIKKFCVSKGQKVKTGTVLIEEYLEEEEEALKSDQRQIDTLQLQISQAKQMRKRELEQLSRTGGSKEEKQNVKTQYDAQIKTCESSLELVRLDMKELQETIRGACMVSELDGTVTFVDNSFSGGYANQENILITVQGKRKNWFRCKTEYADRFKEGQEVLVTALGQQIKTIVKKGKKNVLYLHPKKKLALKNGVPGTVELILKEKKNVLYLPKALIYDVGGKKVVYVEGKNGVKETQEVTTGVQIQNQVEITGGLKENDQILIN